MDTLLMVAVLGIDPVRMAIVALVVVLFMHKAGLWSVVWAALIAIVLAELISTGASSGAARFIPGLIAGLVQGGLVYGIVRMFTKKPVSAPESSLD